MVNDYPFDRPKKVIYNEKKRITNLLSPHNGFVVRDPSVFGRYTRNMGIYMYRLNRMFHIGGTLLWKIKIYDKE